MNTLIRELLNDGNKSAEQSEKDAQVAMKAAGSGKMEWTQEEEDAFQRVREDMHNTDRLYDEAFEMLYAQDAMFTDIARKIKGDEAEIAKWENTIVQCKAACWDALGNKRRNEWMFDKLHEIRQEYEAHKFITTGE